jgi:uncharacterized protein
VDAIIRLESGFTGMECQSRGELRTCYLFFRYSSTSFSGITGGDMKYLSRIVDDQLAEALGVIGAVLIEGPRACGKTATALQHSASNVRLDTLAPTQLELAQADPQSLLKGKHPRLIDEWQLAPAVWNQVRNAVDDEQEPGRFVLTGSATPDDDARRHTGTGRFARLRMHPMSLFESNDSDGACSLAQLISGNEVEPIFNTGTELSDVAHALCRSGFPAYVTAAKKATNYLLEQHIESIAASDIVTVDGIRRDPLRVKRLIFSLARNSATYVSKKTIALDLGSDSPANRKTVDSYLGALERLWIAVPQPAWGERLRSSARVRRAPKWHLADPGLAAAALGATPESLLKEPGAFGQLFESLVFRDLSIYAQANRAQVYSYNDSEDREIDAIVERHGEWAAFEVKLATTPEDIDNAATRLKFLTKGMRRPAKSLNIVVPVGSTYRRKDGVNVIALTNLGP